MKKDTRIIIGICIILLVTAGCFLYKKQSDSSKQISTLEAVSEQDLSASGKGSSSQISQSTSATSSPATPECAVYIAGAVKKPGLYRYYGQARISDAIDAVGGFTKNAAKDAVNLAQILQDGEQITVPTKKEYAKSKQKEYQADTGDKNSASSALININTASSEDLMTLPGVGQAKANLIIEYRTQNGSFSSKEDLMKISGIKEGVYNKIKDLITI